MKLAVVVDRYGADISGGAELHARYIAEHLARYADVRVLTTCARDYVFWRNELPPGEEVINGVAVERFPVAAERDLARFGLLSMRVFEHAHSLHDELAWLESQGPACPSLVARLARGRREFDHVLFFSARYYQTYHGARALPRRAVLVPTAEREDALGLAIFRALFRSVRAIMYNSFEERALIHAIAANEHIPGVVVGVGVHVPDDVQPRRFRQKFGIEGPFVIYVGRIDENKGCAQLFDYFARYADARPGPLTLVLIGTPVLAIPVHPRIRHLGTTSDADKFDGIAAAEALIMPSHYESLSIVALEAWALQRPVLANARCDVLLGQCIRSNAGLYYEDSVEFEAALDRLLGDGGLSAALGRNGRQFYERHYAWPVIERKYLEMFARVENEAPAPVDPLPAWWRRRRPSLPPARDVVRAAPTGPALQRRPRVRESATP